MTSRRNSFIEFLEIGKGVITFEYPTFCEILQSMMKSNPEAILSDENDVEIALENPS